MSYLLLVIVFFFSFGFFGDALSALAVTAFVGAFMWFIAQFTHGKPEPSQRTRVAAMTPEEALDKARGIVEKHKDDDPTNIHSELDDLLCEVLNSLGYGKLVIFYVKQEKWYE